MPNGENWVTDEDKRKAAEAQAAAAAAKQQAYNQAHWGKSQGTDSEGWGAGRYYGGPSFQGGAGTDFGQRMRLLAQRDPRAVAMSTAGMQDAFNRSNQSYGQQSQALDYLKQQVAGNGPSVASVQGVAGQDDALRGMMAHRGQPMLPNAGAGLYSATNQAAAGRAQEMGQAQKGFMGAAGDLRSQTLKERGQNLSTAAKFKDIGLTNQEQNEQRELALQKLALQGYGADMNQENAMADIRLGLAGDEFNRQQQLIGAGINAGASGMAGVSSYFGNQPESHNPNQPKPGGYVGSSDWGNHGGYY